MISFSTRLVVFFHFYTQTSSNFLMQPQGTPENSYLWQRVNSQLSSPSQPYSLREALAQAQSSRIGASAQALRESLHPILRQKLVWFCIKTSCFNLIAVTALFNSLSYPSFSLDLFNLFCCFWKLIVFTSTSGTLGRKFECCCKSSGFGNN